MQVSPKDVSGEREAFISLAAVCNDNNDNNNRSDLFSNRRQ